MKTINTKAILSTARGTEILLPVLTGEQSLVEWAQSIAHESVTTKNGREISAARSALNGAQFAMTNIAMAMRSATELGVLPYTQAVRETKRIYNTLDALRSAFAGVRNEAHRELTVAEITLDVKDGVFDDLQSNTEPYTEEELVDMGLGWDAIEEILLAQEAGMHMRQSELGDSDGSMSEDEGQLRTSIHDANQLWDIELGSIRYAETAAARVALIGMQWPTSNPMWNPLLDRLADTWQAQIEYADDKEAAVKKIERREAALDNLHGDARMARWVVNHVTRRVFRDMAALELKAEEVSDRLNWVERQAMNEERYSVPGGVTRHAMGEQPELGRKAFLFYLELSEAEVQPPKPHSADERELAWHGTQLQLDRTWYNAQLEAIEGLIQKLRPLYRELRAMDQQLAKLWELFDDGQRPHLPPVYWNKDRFFLEGEEDAALAAIRIEAAMAKQRAREAEGDALVKAAALVAQMMGL